MVFNAVVKATVTGLGLLVVMVELQCATVPVFFEFLKTEMSVVPDILRLAIPSGRVPNGIFSVSEDGDFLIGFKDAIGIYLVDISGIWYECWHHHGLDMLADPQPGLKTLVDELCPQSQTDPANFAEITYCPSVEEYFSGVLDTSFMQTSWSQRLREVQLGNKETTKGAFFVALHRSGTLTFWDIQAPLVSWKNVRLMAINRTYFQTYNPPDLPAKPNFVKIVDFSDINFLLILGFTDGKVIGVYYGAYCVAYGKLGLTMVNEVMLCKSTEFITCQDACYAPARGILCLAYGTRVVVCQLNVMVVSRAVCISNTRIIHADGILKPISVISEAKPIISPPSNSMAFHRNLSGLFVSSNAIHVAFLEILFKAAELVNFLMRSGDKPLRGQLDSIQELHRRLLATEPAAKVTSANDMDSFILRPFNYLLDQLLSDENTDYSRMSLEKLQIQSCATCLLLQRKYHLTLAVEEARGLKSLKTDESIVIGPADKGGATLIMDKTDYINKANQIFNDREAYTPLDVDPTKKQVAAAKKKLN
ncbi:unnamed protein product [Schistocephalus solidus]|uniref:Rab3 GTPase-activating protein non-catalytic subunit n=1 Tax=Schistocephalus solidus TaxID=70667 RepID=A0A183TG90_SCHSO|nr:unnamed protein product [Schistocephalus solidus]